MFNLDFIRKDSLTKNISDSSLNLPIINNLNIFIIIKNISKLNKNNILKSISLFDIIGLQKPYIKVIKYNEKNKHKQKKSSFLAKITLRKYKMFLFLRYLDFCLLSEMFNRHIICNTKNDFSYYNFNINNISAFKLLDSYFFNWNYPLYFSLITKNNFIILQFLEKK